MFVQIPTIVTSEVAILPHFIGTEKISMGSYHQMNTGLLGIIGISLTWNYTYIFVLIWIVWTSRSPHNLIIINVI